MAPSRDEFARWRDDPVTRWVLKAHAQLAEDNKAEWVRISWDNGSPNAGALRELKVRADAYEAITQSNYEAYCETNGDEPRDD